MFIKRGWIIRSILFFIGVSFCTLFLNFDIFPLKAYHETSGDELQRIQQQRLNYAAMVRKVKNSTIADPNELNRGRLLGEESPATMISEQTEALFLITSNPYVPDFILQGNYVVQGSSPNKQYTAYIYPDEWETIGDIYIKDHQGNGWTRLQLNQEYRVKMWDYFAPEGKFTPKKKIHWLNNEEFLTIVGLAQGTVSKGGDLVKVHRATGQGEILYPAYEKGNQEVLDFQYEDDYLVLQVNLMDALGLSSEKQEIRIPLKANP